MQLVLAIYFAVMVAHAATGLSALGWNGPAATIHFLGTIPSAVLALFS
jgi:hypothetical protein